jgi:hypothetical protein
MMLRLSGLCFLIAVLTFTQILHSKQPVPMYPSACTLALHPQNNESTRGLPELLWFRTFVYGGSSQRRKSACPKFDMVWLYPSPIPVGRRGVISSL